MSSEQSEKGRQFRALHAAPGAFLIANGWDGGSARILSGLGFKALAPGGDGELGLCSEGGSGAGYLRLRRERPREP